MYIHLNSRVVIVKIIVWIRIGANEVIEADVLPVRLAVVTVTEQVRLTRRGGTLIIWNDSM